MPSITQQPSGLLPGTKKLQQVWTGPSYATTLLVAFIDFYGQGDEKKIQELLDWDPGTILMEIEEDFGIAMPQANYDRLMTAIAIVKSDNFYNSCPDFVDYCNVLSGDAHDPNFWDPAEVEEIAWGLIEATIIEPGDTEQEFDPEILGYIGKALDDEGFVTVPDALQIASRDIDVGSRVQANFGNDPGMLSSIYSAAADKTAAVNTLVKQNLIRLTDQLQALPLQHGTASDFLERIRGASNGNSANRSSS